MHVRTIVIRNGDMFMDYSIYKCDSCGCEIEEMHPRYENDNIHYCFDCGFRKGLVSEKDYISVSGITIAERVAVNPFTNEIELNTGGLFSWEKKDKQQRKTQEYINWRNKVFKRDNYTCQSCGQVGGDLNAHHIKSFKDYKELRTVLDNGITYCINCHKEVHKNGTKKNV